MDIPKQQQHIHAQCLLRECLKPLNIMYSNDTPVALGEHGKPSLIEHPDVHYNLSHADGIVACIVSEHECGIDCEKIREFRLNVMCRAFSKCEQELVHTTPKEDQNLIFFRLWTLKESYIKAIGAGLKFPLKQVNFFFEGDKIISNVMNWKFRQHILREYVVSICEQIVNN